MAWPQHRMFDWRDATAEELAAAKAGRRVSVCIPAHDEAATVGGIVHLVRHELMSCVPLVDEIVVVDDRSTDATVAVATAAGAHVVSTQAMLPELGPGGGKGEALWKSVFASTGDLIVWVDADIRNFGTRFVLGLLTPLLLEPDVGFVKGFYERPIDGAIDGGGRVTELVARPLISLLFPHLAGLVQPLAGEYAGRRDVLEHVPFVQGYGVDLGLLVDISARFGTDAIAQVDLGTRLHRNRSLDDLGPQAMQIMQTAAHKAGLLDLAGLGGSLLSTLVRPGKADLVVELHERPAPISVSAYVAQTALARSGRAPFGGGRAVG